MFIRPQVVMQITSHGFIISLYVAYKTMSSSFAILYKVLILFLGIITRPHFRPDIQDAMQRGLLCRPAIQDTTQRGLLCRQQEKPEEKANVCLLDKTAVF